MMMQRSLSILSFAAAATSGGACGTIMSPSVPGDGSDTMSGDGRAMPDAGMTTPPPLPRSCKELLDGNPALDSGAFTLGTATGASYPAYCDMTDDGGGWTLVLKVDGTIAGSQFGYDNPLWTTTTTLGDDKLDTSHVEAKFRSFSEVAFSKIRIVMLEKHAVAMTTMTVNAAAGSFLSLMRGPFVALSNTRAEWLHLMPDAVLQPDCNQGGINNFVADPYVRVRIGLIANMGMNCLAPDSFIGIGGGGGGDDPCYKQASGTFVPPSVGSIGGGTCNGTATPAPNRAGFAYVYVR
jgi:hypothetical protein